MNELPNSYEVRIWWLLWFFIFTFGCIIFLNFVIAEVSSSYEDVKSNIECTTYKVRASMVKEVEDFLTSKYKKENKFKFPKFVVVREEENN